MVGLRKKLSSIINASAEEGVKNSLKNLKKLVQDFSQSIK